MKNKDISYGHWYPVKPGGMPEDLLGYKTFDKFDITEAVLIPHFWGNEKGGGEYYPVCRIRRKGTNKWEWKQEIYKAQAEYHKAFGRDYLMENWIKADKAPREYPIGTKFKSASGGYWIKNESGYYKWCTGATFPNVGGDYIGLVCLPNKN